MWGPICHRCFCADCEENALDYADGICRNCEECYTSADFDYSVCCWEECLFEKGGEGE